MEILRRKKKALEHKFCKYTLTVYTFSVSHRLRPLKVLDFQAVFAHAAFKHDSRFPLTPMRKLLGDGVEHPRYSHRPTKGCSPLDIAEIDDEQKTSQMIFYSLIKVKQLWTWTGFHSLLLHANTRTVTGGESEGRSSQIISLPRLRSPLPRSPALSLFSFCPRVLWCGVGDLGEAELAWTLSVCGGALRKLPGPNHRP